jgi:hypothetical protein
MWVRGYFAADEWFVSYEHTTEGVGNQRQLRVVSGHGGWDFSCLRFQLASSTFHDEGWSLYHFQYNVTSNGALAKQLGFSFHSVSGPFQGAFASGIEDSITVRLPSWFLLALFGAVPVMHLRKWLRVRLERVRKQNGHCLSCGYDLRASLGTCPECGAAQGTTAAA